LGSENHSSLECMKVNWPLLLLSPLVPSSSSEDEEGDTAVTFLADVGVVLVECFATLVLLVLAA